jgi:hypothetical protein
MCRHTRTRAALHTGWGCEGGGTLLGISSHRKEGLTVLQSIHIRPL